MSKLLYANLTDELKRTLNMTLAPHETEQLRDIWGRIQELTAKRLAQGSHHPPQYALTIREQPLAETPVSQRPEQSQIPVPRLIAERNPLNFINHSNAKPSRPPPTKTGYSSTDKRVAVTITNLESRSPSTESEDPSPGSTYSSRLIARPRVAHITTEELCPTGPIGLATKPFCQSLIKDLSRNCKLKAISGGIYCHTHKTNPILRN